MCESCIIPRLASTWVFPHKALNNFKKLTALALYRAVTKATRNLTRRGSNKLCL